MEMYAILYWLAIAVALFHRGDSACDPETLLKNDTSLECTGITGSYLPHLYYSAYGESESALRRVLVSIRNCHDVAELTQPLIQFSGSSLVLQDIHIEIIDCTFTLRDSTLILASSMSAQWINVTFVLRRTTVAYRRTAVLTESVLLGINSILQGPLHPNSCYGFRADGEKGSRSINLIVENVRVNATIAVVSWMNNINVILFDLSVGTCSPPDRPKGVEYNGTVTDVTISIASVVTLLVVTSPIPHPIRRFRVLNFGDKGLDASGVFISVMTSTCTVSSATTVSVILLSTRSAERLEVNISTATLIASQGRAGVDENPELRFFHIDSVSIIRNSVITFSGVAAIGSLCGGLCLGSNYADANVSAATAALAWITANSNINGTFIVRNSSARWEFTPGIFNALDAKDFVFPSLGESVSVALSNVPIIAALIVVLAPSTALVVQVHDCSVSIDAVNSSMATGRSDAFLRLGFTLAAVVTHPSMDEGNIAMRSVAISMCNTTQLQLRSSQWITRIAVGLLLAAVTLDYEMSTYFSNVAGPAILFVEQLLRSWGYTSTTKQTSLQLLIDNCAVNVPVATQASLLDPAYLNLTSAAYDSIPPLQYCVVLVGLSWNATRVNISIRSSRVDGGSFIGSWRQKQERISMSTISIENSTAGGVMQSLSSGVRWESVALRLEGCRIGLAASTIALSSVAPAAVTSAAVFSASMATTTVRIFSSSVTLIGNVFWSFHSAMRDAMFTNSTLVLGCNTLCNTTPAVSDCSVLQPNEGERIGFNATDGNAMSAAPALRTAASGVMSGLPLSCAVEATTTPPSAALAAMMALAVAAGGGGAGDLQALLTLSSGECSPASLRSQSSLAKVALSPFFDLGDGAMVLGNAGLVALCAGLQGLLVAHLRRSGGLRLRAALTAARAPQWTYRAWLLLHIGVTKAALGLLLRRHPSSADAGDALLAAAASPASSAVAVGVFGLLFNGACLFLVLHAHRTVLRDRGRRGSSSASADERGDAESRAEERSSGMQRGRRARDGSGASRRAGAAASMYTRRWPRRLVASVVPAWLRWAMPAARWKPDWLRRQLGALVSPVRGERRHWALYLVVVPTAIAVLASLPLSGTALCPLTWAASAAVTAGVAASIGVLRPHRVSAMNVIQVVAFGSLTVLCVLVAAGVTSVTLLGVLSLLQSALSLCRGVLTLFVFLMEERMDSAIVSTAFEIDSKPDDALPVMMPSFLRKREIFSRDDNELTSRFPAQDKALKTFFSATTRRDNLKHLVTCICDFSRRRSLEEADLF